MIELRYESKKNDIANLHASIQELTAKVNELNNQVINLTQEATSQALFIKEWKKAVKTIDQLFVEASGVFNDPESLDELVLEIQDLAEQRKAEFEENAQKENRFIREATKEAMPVLPETIEVESTPLLLTEKPKETPHKTEITLPEPTDNVEKLTQEQIEMILSELTMKKLDKLKNEFGCARASKLETIAETIVGYDVTYSDITDVLIR